MVNYKLLKQLEEFLWEIHDNLTDYTSTEDIEFLAEEAHYLREVMLNRKELLSDFYGRKKSFEILRRQEQQL